MLKRIVLIGAMVALTIAKPSNAVAQGWDGWGGGITVNVRVPFPRRDFCCEERRFFPRRVFCCEEPRFFPRPVFCCDDRRFFPRPFGRPPYFYGDSFAPYRYNWNGGYTNAGYGY